MSTALISTAWAWAAAELALQARQRLRSGRTERSEWRSLLVIWLLFGGGVAAAMFTRHAVTALSYPTHGQVLRAVVLAVVWAGIALRLWSIIALGRFFRATVHIQQGHRLVSSGPYRWVRHPSYSGMLLGLLGFAVLVGNALSWLVFAVCALAAMAYRIRVEERMLLDALGEDYRAYAARTRRLIPGVW
ncbi:methyltransferase family protein [Streptomyces sp. NPDC001407]|uniref:methyltransferase family protein n=1 Tax=unclassified Streptomyces TaxID=2593676 RepID=UPI0033E944C0